MLRGGGSKRFSFLKVEGRKCEQIDLEQKFLLMPTAQQETRTSTMNAFILISIPELKSCGGCLYYDLDYVAASSVFSGSCGDNRTLKS